MSEETFVGPGLMLVGLVAVALLGAVAFALYWFLGGREDE